MKKFFASVLSLCLLVQFSGCSVVKALKQPDKKDLSILTQGMDKENIVAYLGAPISSEEKEGKKVEIYQFQQGYSGGVKASRATMHFIFDLLTLCIWEIVGWPMETIIDGHQMTVKVVYNDQNKIEDFNILRTE